MLEQKPTTCVESSVKPAALARALKTKAMCKPFPGKGSSPVYSASPAVCRVEASFGIPLLTGYSAGINALRLIMDSS